MCDYFYQWLHSQISIEVDKDWIIFLFICDHDECLANFLVCVVGQETSSGARPSYCAQSGRQLENLFNSSWHNWWVVVGPIEEAQLGLGDGTDEAGNDGTGLHSDGHGLRAISNDYHRSVNAHPETRYSKKGYHNHLDLCSKMCLE